MRIAHKEKCLNALPERHKKWLTKYGQDLDQFKDCILKNAEFLPIVLKHANNIFEDLYSSENAPHNETEVGTLSEGLDKVIQNKLYFCCFLFSCICSLTLIDGPRC